jgi:hypothetical protein
VEALARYGLGTKAPTLRGLTEPRRTATLLATARALEVTAVDDVLGLFSLLMATKLLAWAERESNKQRQRDMPRLALASVTLAKAARVLLAADARALTATELWAEIERVTSRDKVASAIEAVEELAPFGEEDDDADRRAELVKRYATVRPFLPMLTAVVPFGATDAGAPVLAGRKRVRPVEVDGALVTGSRRRLVLANPDLPAGTVDHRAPGSEPPHGQCRVGCLAWREPGSPLPRQPRRLPQDVDLRRLLLRQVHIEITRIFDAPRELVYRAFTDPGQLAQ